MIFHPMTRVGTSSPLVAGSSGLVRTDSEQSFFESARSLYHPLHIYLSDPWENMNQNSQLINELNHFFYATLFGKRLDSNTSIVDCLDGGS